MQHALSGWFTLLLIDWPAFFCIRHHQFFLFTLLTWISQKYSLEFFDINKLLNIFVFGSQPAAAYKQPLSNIRRPNTVESLYSREWLGVKSSWNWNISFIKYKTMWIQSLAMFMALVNFVVRASPIGTTYPDEVSLIFFLIDISNMLCSRIFQIRVIPVMDANDDGHISNPDNLRYEIADFKRLTRILDDLHKVRTYSIKGINTMLTIFIVCRQHNLKHMLGLNMQSQSHQL